MRQITCAPPSPPKKKNERHHQLHGSIRGPPPRFSVVLAGESPPKSAARRPPARRKRPATRCPGTRPASAPGPDPFCFFFPTIILQTHLGPFFFFFFLFSGDRSFKYTLLQLHMCVCVFSFQGTHLGLGQHLTASHLGACGLKRWIPSQCFNWKGAHPASNPN